MLYFLHWINKDEPNIQYTSFCNQAGIRTNCKIELNFMKKILIPLLFSLPFISFSQSLVPIAKDGKWALIVPQENKVEGDDYPYQFITPNNQFNVFKVGKDFKIGILNQNGNTILPCEYDRIEIINDNLYVVWDKKGASIIDGSKNTLTTKYYDHISPMGSYFLVSKNEKKGVLKNDGSEICPTDFDEIKLSKDNPIFLVKKNNKKGFLNLHGNQQEEIEYKEIQSIANGQLLGTFENTPFVSFLLIDKEGSFKTKKQFNKISDFKAFQKKFYLGALKKEFSKSNPHKPQWLEVMGDHYLIAPNGKELLEGKSFFYIQTDNNSKFTIARREERDGSLNYYLIDSEKGTILFKETFKDIVFADFGESNWARISIDTLWDGLINKEGDIKRTILAGENKHTIQDIGNFFEGFAYYKTVENNYGFINKEAKSTIPPNYNLASDFKEGFSIVKKNDSFGAINHLGEIIIPIQYDGISLCNNGWFRVKKGTGYLGKWGIIDTKGKIILEFNYQEINIDNKGANVMKDGKWGRFLKSKKWAFSPSLKVNKLHAFENGIAKIERGPLYDPIDRKTLIGYKYEGFINESGKVIIPPTYKEVIGFQRAWNTQEGLAIINKNGLHGFVNYQGEIVLDATFKSTGNFTEIWTIHKGIAKVVDQDNLVSFVDSNGKEVLPYEFNDITEQYQKVWNDSNGVCIASYEDNYGLINYKGERKTPFVYQKLFQFNDSLFVAASNQKKWGLINSQGDSIIYFNYNNAIPISNKYVQFIQDSTLNYTITDLGLWKEGITEAPISNTPPSLKQKKEYTYHYIDTDYAIVSKKGKSNLQGVVDYNHKVIIKLNFRKIKPFTNELAVAQQNGKSAKDRKYGYINRKGKWVIPPTYNNALSFNEGLAPVSAKGKWGFINETNTIIIPIKYSAVSAFENNIAVVNHKTIISKEGQTIGQLFQDEFIKKVTTRHIIIKGTGYERHLSFNGITLYDNKFDEVTSFNASGIAFVKTGELWLLKRKINDNNISKPFSKLEMETYLKKYGHNRKVVSLTGDVAQDLKFEKIKNGVWRMIGLDGMPLNNIVFKNVKEQGNGNFTFEINKVGKIINDKGNTITDYIQSSKGYNNGLLIYSEGNSSFIQ